MAPSRHFWETELSNFGARSEDIVVLDDSAKPTEMIRYLDIMRRAEKDAASVLPKAIVEANGQPILYVVDMNDIARLGNHSLPVLRRMLAFRAGADYVGLFEPGRITVLPVAPVSKKDLAKKTRAIDADETNASTLIPSLAFPSLEEGRGNTKRASNTAIAVHDLLYKLLTTTTTVLTEARIEHLDALSLVGRALFVRFLVDRNVLVDADLASLTGASTETCFSTAKHAWTICRWLDNTFNGDFLPLPEKGSRRWFNSLPAVVFHELSKILQRATPSGQLHLKWGDKWNDLLFDHIPVGLLSQVYEHHAHLFDPLLAEVTSVRYTPRHIAEYMVDEVFLALGEAALGASVLDPAVGGGVFLVAAFRRLAAERWNAEGVAPNTRKLRSILYKQLRGFDISAPALRLSSLGLYLTAVELDPSPSPRTGLKFDKPLLGTVLFDVSSRDKRHTFIGSLDPEKVGAKHDGKYDVVIGNPPWNTWTVSSPRASRSDREAGTTRILEENIQAQVAQVERTVSQIVRERVKGDYASQYSMVDRVPDIPFLWRAMKWAKEGGCIAFALHARLLFKQTDAEDLPRGHVSRMQIFQAITVTGVLNGSALRDTKYWPDVRAHFCLLFAKNSRPPKNSSFWFVSPEMEKKLNDQGRTRVDEGSANPVAVEDLDEQPWLLKALSRGTVLDLRVLDRIERVADDRLFAYWDRQGEDWRKRRGQGFKVGGLTRTPAEDLWGMPKLTRHSSAQFEIDPTLLPRVEHGAIMERSRSRELYESPLVLIGESLPVNRVAPAAHLCFGDVAFNQSYVGFSCAGHGDAEVLARYLFLLLNSNVLTYCALMTSARFGLERDVLLVEDVGRMPFRLLESLPSSLKKEVRVISDALLRRGSDALDDVDELVAEIYGLSRSDCEVIRDTLDVGLPFAHNRARAQVRPRTQEVQYFLRQLKQILLPFVGRRGRVVSLRIIRNELLEPWLVLQLDSHVKGTPAPKISMKDALEDLVEAADSLAATQIVAVRPPGTLIIGVVAQYRYFTPSRARMLGLDLLQRHEEMLLGGEGFHR